METTRETKDFRGCTFLEPSRVPVGGERVHDPVDGRLHLVPGPGREHVPEVDRDRARHRVRVCPHLARPGRFEFDNLLRAQNTENTRAVHGIAVENAKSSPKT